MTATDRRIRELAKLADLEIGELGQKAWPHLSEDAARRRVERAGREGPQIQVLKQLAKVLGCELADFFQERVQS